MPKKSFIENELDREARLRGSISRNKAITATADANKLNFKAEQRKSFNLIDFYTRCMTFTEMRSQIGLGDKSN